VYSLIQLITLSTATLARVSMTSSKIISGHRRQDHLYRSHRRRRGRRLAPLARVPLRIRRRRPEVDDLGHKVAGSQQAIAHCEFKFLLFDWLLGTKPNQIWFGLVPSVCKKGLVFSTLIIIKKALTATIFKCEFHLLISTYNCSQNSVSAICGSHLTQLLFLQGWRSHRGSQLPVLQPLLGVHPGLRVGRQDGGSLGPAKPEAETALVRIAQGRDFPGWHWCLSVYCSALVFAQSALGIDTCGVKLPFILHSMPRLFSALIRLSFFRLVYFCSSFYLPSG